MHDVAVRVARVAVIGRRMHGPGGHGAIAVGEGLRDTLHHLDLLFLRQIAREGDIPVPGQLRVLPAVGALGFVPGAGKLLIIAEIVRGSGRRDGAEGQHVAGMVALQPFAGFFVLDPLAGDIGGDAGCRASAAPTDRVLMGVEPVRGLRHDRALPGGS